MASIRDQGRILQDLLTRIDKLEGRTDRIDKLEGRIERLEGNALRTEAKLGGIDLKREDLTRGK